jgi:hypothetical protein
MANLVHVNLRLNTAALSAAKNRVMALNPQCAAHLANKTIHFIASHAHKNMPVVIANKIAAELMASKPVKRVGKLVGSGSLRRGWRFGGQTIGKHEDVPLLALIINSSVLRVSNSESSQPGMSNFNRRTGMVFARESSPFRGKSRKAGAAAMLAKMKQILGARRSSSGFYKLGAAVVKFIFHKNFAPVRMPPSDNAIADTGEATAGSGTVSKAIGRVAGGTRATPNKGTARASFWVSTTEPDSKGDQRAFNRVLQPVWQRAVDAEASNTEAYAEKLYTQALRNAGFAVR